jgi:hypothetical protein
MVINVKTPSQQFGVKPIIQYIRIMEPVTINPAPVATSGHDYIISIGGI